jgi:hypothetical protein
MSRAGTGSGDCFATAAGALDRSMPVIDRLTSATTADSASVTTHVAAVSSAILPGVTPQPVVELR